MAVSRYLSNNDIINRVAVEVGLSPETDVFASSDPAFRQLIYLLTAAAQELLELYPWQILTRTFQYTTVANESGDLILPADFAYMLDQTGLERSQNVPLIGPLSAQEWTYLLGRDLVGSTIYASFRFDQGEFKIFPNDPMPAGLDINFEYISRNLFNDVGGGFSDTALAATSTSVFPPNLITRLLKKMFLEAKGFDAQKATDSYNLAFEAWTGRDNSAPILNAGRGGQYFPYLNVQRNLPDTGFGGV